MECDVAVQLDPSIFADNLTALREVDAGLAEALERLPIEPAVPAVGRDESITFRIPADDGHEQWFGRTSMPTVSGPALLERFRCASSNVALPGIGQGIEARLLVEQLAAHRAVFVLEPDGRRAAWALRLHRMADPIRRGRIVWIVATPSASGPSEGFEPWLAEQLSDFLIRNPAYLVPDRLMPWPWMKPADIEPFKRILRQGGERAVQGRGPVFADIERRLAAASDAIQQHRTPRRIVTLALQPSRHSSRRAKMLAAAAERAKVAYCDCIADAPSRGQAVAHLQAVADHQPGLAVLLDHTRADLPHVFPATLPAVTWFDSPSLLVNELPNRIGPIDRLAPTSPYLAKRCAALGIPRHRVHVLPAAAPVSEPTAARAEQDVPVAYRCDVAMFADGADLDPAAWGITLDSHVMLYRALVERLEREGHRFFAQSADDVLQRCQRSLGIEITDEEVRGVLRRQIEQVIGPTQVCLGVLRELTAAGLHVRLYGRGWGSHEPVRDMWGGEIGDAGTEPLAVAGCKLLVHADPSGGVPHPVFAAAGAERPVVIRAHPFDREDGGLATLFRVGAEVLTYSLPREAASLAARLLNDSDAARQIAAAARERVESSHTLAQRLERIVEWVSGDSPLA